MTLGVQLLLLLLGASDLDRARELVAAGKPLEAIAIYERHLAAAPGNSALQMNLAVARFKAAQYERVIALCRKLLERHPQPPGAWLFLGASLHQLGRHVEAIEPLQQYLDLQPADRNARLMLGESLVALGRHEEAIAQLDRAATQLPGEPRVWYGLAQAHRALAEAAERDIDRSPGTAEWHALTAGAAARTGRHGLALHHYREALRLDGRLEGVREGMADVYRATGRADWAAAVASEQGQSGSTVYKKARAHRAAADEAFERLRSLPPSTQLHELEARRHHEAGRYAEAAGHWRQAGSQRGLAVALLELRDFAGAAPVIADLLRAGAPDAHLLAGRLKLETEQPAAAVTHLEKAGPAAQLLLGEALLKADRPAEAIPHLKAGLDLDPDGSRHFQLARALQATGQTEAARKAMERYRALQKEAAARREELDREYPIGPP